MDIIVKTGREILEECLASVRKNIKKSLDTKYVRLKDYEKKIEIINSCAIIGCNRVMGVLCNLHYDEYLVKEGWYFPELIRKKSKYLRSMLCERIYTPQGLCQEITNSKDLTCKICWQIEQVFGAERKEK